MCVYIMAGDFNDQVPTLFFSKYEFNVVCSPLIQCVVILMVIGLKREWRRESVFNAWALCVCLYKHGRAKVKVLFLVNSLQCTCIHIHPDTTQQQHTFPVQQKSTSFLWKFTHLQKAMKMFQTLMLLKQEIYLLYCAGYLILPTLCLTAASCFIVGIKFSISPPNLTPIHPHV